MQVFLTGGSGFIGRALTRALRQRGWHVTALVRSMESSGARHLAGMGVQCVVGDVRDRESVQHGMRGAEVVIHNAAWYELGISRRARHHMHAVNVTGTDHVLGTAMELAVPRTVHVSSVAYFADTGAARCGEDHPPQSDFPTAYTQTKAEAHARALAWSCRGLPLIIVCPTHVFGANDHSPFGYFLRLYLNGLMAPFAFSPEMQMAPVHVDDLGEGIARAAERGRCGETYILGGDTMSIRDMFKLWMTRPGGAKVRFYIPRWLACLLFRPLEPLQRLVGLPAFLSAETVNATRYSYDFSSAKAQRELAWRPRPPSAIWADIIDREIQLRGDRQGRGLVSRLAPLD